MCNPKSAGSQYYRCGCDTSEKRQLRRVNRKARSAVDNPLTPLSEKETPPPLPVDYTPTLNPRENITTLKSLYDEHYSDVHTSMLITKEIGKNTSLLAEEKAGFTHEDMQKNVDTLQSYENQIDDLKSKFSDKTLSQEKKDEYNAQIAELYEKRKQPYKDFVSNHEAMGQAYKEAIAEARGEPLGAERVGLTVSDHKDSYKRLAKKIEPRLDCFPESWVEASNSRNNLAPRESTRRSHYAQNTSVVTERRIIPYIFDKSNPPKPDEAHKYRKLTEEEVRSHVDPSIVSPVEDYYEKVGWTRYSELEHGKMKDDGTPPGPRWQLNIIQERDYSQSGEVYREKTLWMRKKPTPRSKANVSKSVKLSELTIPPVKRAGEEEAKRVTIHEFSHRMEDSIPRLGKLQGAFLRSRKKTDKMVSIYDEGKEEKAYDAGFQNLYSSKFYNDGDVHFEVMSTGMEGLFNKEDNTDGIFYSKKNPQMDTDFKDFVLGTVTTVKAGEM